MASVLLTGIVVDSLVSCNPFLLLLRLFPLLNMFLLLFFASVAVCFPFVKSILETGGVWLCVGLRKKETMLAFFLVLFLSCGSVPITFQKDVHIHFEGFYGRGLCNLRYRL